MYKTIYMYKPFSQCEPGTKVVTGEKIITAGDVDIFANITKNELPMFLLEDAAKAYKWRTRIVPGAYTLACTIGLEEACGILSDVLAYVSLDELRFLAPVYPGDVIHVEIELLSKRLTKEGDRGLIEYRWITYNQNGEAVLQGKNRCMFKVPQESKEPTTTSVEQLVEARKKDAA